MKSTPGPWKMNGRGGAVSALIDGNVRQVALATAEAPMHDARKHLTTAEIQTANAHLIAAAPDLLAACQAVQFNLCSRTSHLPSDVALQIEKAIAKALGTAE